MSDELTNLLPPARQQSLISEYHFRRGVVIIALMIVLTLVAAVLLIPTHVFLTASAAAKEEHLATIKSTLSSAEEQALSTRLATLSTDTAALAALSSNPSASATLRMLLAISRPGITLSGFVYTAAQGKDAGTLAVSGIAATRDALRNYQLTLQSVAFASAADLPVSDYAKDANIAFTVTLTLTP